MGTTRAERLGRKPNQSLQQTAAAILVSRSSLSLSAAAAAELNRSATEVRMANSRFFMTRDDGADFVSFLIERFSAEFIPPFRKPSPLSAVHDAVGGTSNNRRGRTFFPLLPLSCAVPAVGRVPLGVR